MSKNSFEQLALNFYHIMAVSNAEKLLSESIYPLYLQYCAGEQNHEYIKSLLEGYKRSEAHEQKEEKIRKLLIFGFVATVFLLTFAKSSTISFYVTLLCVLFALQTTFNLGKSSGKREQITEDALGLSLIVFEGHKKHVIQSLLEIKRKKAS